MVDRTLFCAKTLHLLDKDRDFISNGDSDESTFHESNTSEYKQLSDLGQL